MIRARVNGVNCIIYDYINTGDYIICNVKYDGYSILLPVIAELIEVAYD